MNRVSLGLVRRFGAALSLVGSVGAVGCKAFGFEGWVLLGAGLLESTVGHRFVERLLRSD